MKHFYLWLLAFFVGWHSQAQTDVTIGTASAANGYFPVGVYYNYTYTQQLLTPADIGSSGLITKLRFYSTGTTLTNLNQWDIYLGHTTKSSFSSTTDWINSAQMNMVFSGTVTTTPTAGWLEIVLDTPFYYNGTSNLVLAVDENSSGYTGTSTTTIFYVTSNDYTNRALYYRTDSTNPNPATITATGIRVNYINHMQLHMDTDYQIAPCESPVAISAASVTTKTNTAINLAFEPSTDNARYLVVRSTSATAPEVANGTMYTVGSTALGTGTNVRQFSANTSLSDTGLTAGTQYYYHIYAANTNCEGEPVYSAPYTLEATTRCAFSTTVTSFSYYSDSAQINWTGTGTYLIEYGPQGYTPGTEGTAGVGGTLVSTNATSPYTISGLNGQTSYTVYIRQLCGTGGYSVNSSANTFTTACNAITNYPYTNPFTTVLASCWLAGKGGNNTSGPATFGSSNWTSDTWLNGVGNQAAKINIDSNSDNEWLISPFFTIESNMRLLYKVAAMQWNSSNPLTNPWEDDDFVEVLYSTSNSDWNVLARYDATNVPSHLGQTETISLAALEGQTVRFAFRAVEGTANGSADIDFMVDDFLVEVIPSCLPVTNVIATQNADGTVTITWDGEYAFVEWGVAGCTAGTDDAAGECGAILAGNSPQVIAGLASNTQYTVSVRTDCTTTGNGYATNVSKTFTTPRACPDDLSASTVTVTNFPYSVSNQTTCGNGNTITGTSLGVVAGSSSYFGGEDATYILIPDQDGIYNITLTTATDQDSSIALYQGCPYAPSSTVLGFVQNLTFTPRVLQVELTAGELYYLIVDNFPSPNCVTSYNLTIELLATPDCTTATPVDASTNVVRNPALTWSAVANATAYNVYMGTAEPLELVASNLTTLTYTPAVLAANTTYYFRIEPFNLVGANTSCAVQSFTTGEELNYCASVPTSKDGNGITNVNIQGTNFPIGGVTYYDAKSSPVEVYQGQTVEIAGTFDTGYTYDTHVWIDFNKNGVFDSTERVFTGVAAATRPTTLTMAFDLPQDIALGTYVGRIGSADSGQSPPTPCYNSSFGVTVDFKLTVGEMPADLPDYVNLQYPASATILRSESVTIYGQVYEGGLTDVEPGYSGQAAGIDAWVGVHTSNTDPSTWPSTAWTEATFNANHVSNNDEYSAQIGANLAVGTYYYATRYRLNNGAYVYGGIQQGETNFGNFWNGTEFGNGILTVNANPTQCAQLVTPAAATTDVALGTVALTWTAPTTGPTPTGYKVYFGTNAASLTLATTTGANVFTYTVNAAAYGTTYYWRIVPTSTIGGDATACETRSFTTMNSPFAPYCDVQTFGTNGSGVEPISYVEFANIANSSSAANSVTISHENFIDQVAEVTTESTYLLTVKGNTEGSYTNYIRAYIDWNQNGEFETSEGYTVGTLVNTTGTDAQAATFAITVPANAVSGTTRMRIVKVYSNPNATNIACGTGGYGQAEDYSVNVTVCTPSTWYADADGDGYGDDAVTVVACNQPAGYAAVGGDCNDNAALVNPGMSEILYNGIDDNCDGNLDEGHQVTTRVISAQCGTTLSAVTTTIHVNSNSRATAYRFKVYNMTTQEENIIERTTNYFGLADLPMGGTYGTTYRISAELQYYGIWLGYYGEECFVSTPPHISDEQGSTTTCDTQLESITSIVHTYAGTNVEYYRFKFTHYDENNEEVVEIVDRERPWINFSTLETAKYGTTYMVEVATKLRSSASYSAYAAPCIIISPDVPAIESCGVQAATRNTSFLVQTAAQVRSWRFELTNMETFETMTIVRPLRYIRFVDLPSYQPGAEYGIRVSVMTNGNWSPYGAACSVWAPMTAARQDIAITQFDVKAYPNTFEDDFRLKVTLPTQDRVEVRLYDMLGKELDVRNLEAADVEFAYFGKNVPAGVYNVVVTQGTEVKTVRVIKK